MAVLPLFPRARRFRPATDGTCVWAPHGKGVPGPREGRPRRPGQLGRGGHVGPTKEHTGESH